MDPEEEFLQRMNEIHGFLRDRGPRRNAKGFDVRHQEFQAMADFRLGKGYDPEKLRRVEDEQIRLDKREAELSRLNESHQLTGEQFFESLQSAFEKTLGKYEEILGKHDFEKLFGVPPSAASRLVDRESFLQSHMSAEGMRVPPASAVAHGEPAGAIPERLFVVAGEIKKMASLAGLRTSTEFLEALSARVAIAVRKGARPSPAKRSSGAFIRRPSRHRDSGAKSLVTTSAVKRAVQAQGYKAGGDFLEGLSAMVRENVEKAIAKVRTDGKKKTLGPEDL